jgi:hypothetical protein
LLRFSVNPSFPSRSNRFGFRVSPTGNPSGLFAWTASRVAWRQNWRPLAAQPRSLGVCATTGRIHRPKHLPQSLRRGLEIPQIERNTAHLRTGDPPRHG